MTVALEGIKVLDLTRTLAGPFCTMLLADMGADVVKVEEPSLGDETRSWTPFWNGVSTQFLAFNRNKRSVTLNLKDSRAIEVCLKLAKEADVLVESFRPGTLDRLGLGYDVIKRENPRIVYCSISGFGVTGPMGVKPGYDLIVQGYGGVMSLTGEPDGASPASGLLHGRPVHRNDGLWCSAYRADGQGAHRRRAVPGGLFAGGPCGHHELPRCRLSGYWS